MVRDVRVRFGRIDILINNAGIIRVAPLENVTIQDFEEAMAVMFWGVVYPTLAVLDEMKERRAGRIATIASVGGKISVPHLLPSSVAVGNGRPRLRPHGCGHRDRQRTCFQSAHDARTSRRGAAE